MTRTALELSSVGAPGCRLLTSSEVLIPTVTDASRMASLGLPIPGSVADPGSSSALQLAFSGGLEVLLER